MAPTTKNITLTTTRQSLHQEAAREIGLQVISSEYDDLLLQRLGINNQPEHLIDDAKIKDGKNGKFKFKEL